MARYFTHAQAESLLPEVSRTLQKALDLAAAHERADSKLQDTLRRLSMLGGAIADQRAISELRDRCDQTASEVNDAISEIHSYGCQVKDLHTGLVDFPTLYRGEEVLLCWKFGEHRIQFWHGLEEGFRGRKPIDREFLDNHCGDRPH